MFLCLYDDIYNLMIINWRSAGRIWAAKPSNLVYDWLPKYTSIIMLDKYVILISFNVNLRLPRSLSRKILALRSLIKGYRQLGALALHQGHHWFDSPDIIVLFFCHRDAKANFSY